MQLSWNFSKYNNLFPKKAFDLRSHSCLPSNNSFSWPVLNTDNEWFIHCLPLPSSRVCMYLQIFAHNVQLLFLAHNLGDLVLCHLPSFISPHPLRLVLPLSASQICQPLSCLCSSHHSCRATLHWVLCMALQPSRRSGLSLTISLLRGQPWRPAW